MITTAGIITYIVAVLYFGSAVIWGIIKGWKKATSRTLFPYVFCYSLNFTKEGKWADSGDILWIIPLIHSRTGKWMKYDDTAWFDMKNESGETQPWYMPEGHLALNGFPEDEELRRAYFKRYKDILEFFIKRGVDPLNFKFDKKNGTEKKQFAEA